MSEITVNGWLTTVSPAPRWSRLEDCCELWTSLDYSMKSVSKKKKKRLGDSWRGERVKCFSFSGGALSLNPHSPGKARHHHITLYPISSQGSWRKMEDGLRRVSRSFGNGTTIRPYLEQGENSGTTSKYVL